MSRGQQAIRCYARIKPLQNDENSVLKVTNKQIIASGTAYQFHQVFDSSIENKQIFNKTVLKMIQQGLDGFNACVLAYGQTSSGKTYTMKGEVGQLGLIPLSVKELFRRVQEGKITAQVRVSYFQIYNENIIDLLSDSSAYLQLREEKKVLTVVSLTEEIVRNELDALRTFEKGESKRKYADNNVNTLSSRSHAVFRIILDVVQKNYSTTSSVVQMVDLAGSEAIHKTKAEGVLRKEADNINRSLLALSNVIRQMSEKNTYVNFRDSKLTRILQPCLCSNGLCFIVCTIKQDEDALAQTINTLKFGVTAANIKITIRKNLQTNQKDLFSLELKQEKERTAMLNKEIESLKYTLELSRGQLSKKNKELDLIKHLLMKEEMEKISQRQTAEIYKSKYQEISAKNNIFSAQTGNILQIVQRDRSALNEECNNYKRIIKENQSKIKQLLENQTTLIERLNTFHREIKVLEQKILTSNETNNTKVNGNKENEMTRVEHKSSRKIFIEQQSPCILTINNVIKLDVKILQMKREMMEYIRCNAALQQEVNQLTEQIKLGKDIDEPQVSVSSKRHILSKAQEEARENKLQIHKLRNQLDRIKQREKKYLKLLKEQSRHRIDEIDGFVAYVEREKQKNNSNKHIYKVYTGDQNPDVY